MVMEEEGRGGATGREAKTEMGSAVNIGMNGGAIGMNRSGWPYCRTWTYFSVRRFSFSSFFLFSFFFLCVSLFAGESNLESAIIRMATTRWLFVCTIRSFILITPLSSPRSRTVKEARSGKRNERTRRNFLISSERRWFKFPSFPHLQIIYATYDSHEFLSGQRILRHDQTRYSRMKRWAERRYKSYPLVYTLLRNKRTYLM